MIYLTVSKESPYWFPYMTNVKLLLPRTYKLDVLVHRTGGQIRVYKRPARRSFSRDDPTVNQGGLSAPSVPK
jgi:hypothetical protein